MDITSIKTSKTVDGQAATIVEATFTSPRFDAAHWGGGDTVLGEDIRAGKTFWAVRLDGKSAAGGKRFSTRAGAERWLAKNADPAWASICFDEVAPRVYGVGDSAESAEGEARQAFRDLDWSWDGSVEVELAPEQAQQVRTGVCELKALGIAISPAIRRLMRI